MIRAFSARQDLANFGRRP